MLITQITLVYIIIDKNISFLYVNDLFKMTSHFLQVIPEGGKNLQEMDVIFLVLYAQNLHGIDMIFSMLYVPISMRWI
jgi:hypothetical protein